MFALIIIGGWLFWVYRSLETKFVRNLLRIEERVRSQFYDKCTIVRLYSTNSFFLYSCGYIFDEKCSGLRKDRRKDGRMDRTTDTRYKPVYPPPPSHTPPKTHTKFFKVGYQNYRCSYVLSGTMARWLIIGLLA